MRKSVMGRSEISCCDVEDVMLGLKLVLMWCQMMAVSSMMPKYRVREAAVERCARAIGAPSLSSQLHTTSVYEYGPIATSASEKEHQKARRVITCAILLPWAGEPVLLERRRAAPLASDV